VPSSGLTNIPNGLLPAIGMVEITELVTVLITETVAGL
jgi:hypothetical protein